MAGADVEYVVDFSARGTWDNIANPQYLFDEWADTPYRLVYGVPLLPTDVEGVSIQAGAAGDYNDYFRNLADNLVKAGQEDAVLRVGWEFNLESWKWASDDAESWKAFYRNVVETMRSVDGAKFEFDWNVNGGPNKYDAANYYPGDDVVDYVGVDAYDVSGAAYPYPDDCDSACYVKAQKKAWDVSIYGGDRGLQYWSQFAKDHGKPLSIPEWGSGPAQTASAATTTPTTSSGCTTSSPTRPTTWRTRPTSSTTTPTARAAGTASRTRSRTARRSSRNCSCRSTRRPTVRNPAQVHQAVPRAG